MKPERKIFIYNPVKDKHRPPSLLEKYPALYWKVKWRQVGGLRTEILHGKDRVIAMRASDCIRLLFIEHANGDVTFLEELDNHQYHQAYFLSEAGHAILSSKEPLPVREEIAEEAVNIVEEGEELEARECYEYNKMYILLSEEQEVLLELSGPTLLVGVAGCGKTSSGKAILEERIKTLNPGEKALYIAKEPGLVASMEKNFSEEEKSKIDFLSQVQFLKVQGVDIPKKQQANFSHFCTFLKNKRYTNDPQLSMLYYRNCLIADAYDETTYQALPSRETEVSVEERDMILKLLKEYRGFLREKQLVDLNIALVTIQRKWAFILADEFMDFRGKMLNLLYESALNEEIIFVGDPYQCLEGYDGSGSYLKRLIPHIKVETLTESKRCRAQIARLGNHTMGMMRYVLGGTEEKGQFVKMSSSHQEEGTIRFLSESTLGIQLFKEDFAKAMAKDFGFVVLTRPERVADVKKEYQTERVFTINDFKGLEGKVVLIDDVLSDKRFKTLNDFFIEDIDFDTVALNQTKSREEKGDIRLLKELHTMITRAFHDVIFLQNPFYGSENILKELQKYKTEVSQEQLLFPSISYQAKTRTEEEWYAYVISLIENNCFPQAAFCYQKYCKNAPKTFEELEKEHHLKADEPALVHSEPISQKRKKKKKKKKKNKKKPEERQEITHTSVVRSMRNELYDWFERAVLEHLKTRDLNRFFVVLKRKIGVCWLLESKSLLLEDTFQKPLSLYIFEYQDEELIQAIFNNIKNVNLFDEWINHIHTNDKIFTKYDENSLFLEFCRHETFLLKWLQKYQNKLSGIYQKLFEEDDLLMALPSSALLFLNEQPDFIERFNNIPLQTMFSTQHGKTIFSRLLEKPWFYSVLRHWLSSHLEKIRSIQPLVAPFYDDAIMRQIFSCEEGVQILVELKEHGIHIPSFSERILFYFEENFEKLNKNFISHFLFYVSFMDSEESYDIQDKLRHYFFHQLSERQHSFFFHLLEIPKGVAFLKKIRLNQFIDNYPDKDALCQKWAQFIENDHLKALEIYELIQNCQNRDTFLKRLQEIPNIYSGARFFFTLIDRKTPISDRLLNIVKNKDYSKLVKDSNSEKFLDYFLDNVRTELDVAPYSDSLNERLTSLLKLVYFTSNKSYLMYESFFKKISLKNLVNLVAYYQFTPLIKNLLIDVVFQYLQKGNSFHIAHDDDYKIFHEKKKKKNFPYTLFLSNEREKECFLSILRNDKKGVFLSWLSRGKNLNAEVLLMMFKLNQQYLFLTDVNLQSWTTFFTNYNFQLCEVGKAEQDLMREFIQYYNESTNSFKYPYLKWLERSEKAKQILLKESAGTKSLIWHSLKEDIKNSDPFNLNASSEAGLTLTFVQRKIITLSQVFYSILTEFEDRKEIDKLLNLKYWSDEFKSFVDTPAFSIFLNQISGKMTNFYYLNATLLPKDGSNDRYVAFKKIIEVSNKSLLFSFCSQRNFLYGCYENLLSTISFLFEKEDQKELQRLLPQEIYNIGLFYDEKEENNEKDEIITALLRSYEERNPYYPVLCYFFEDLFSTLHLSDIHHFFCLFAEVLTEKNQILLDKALSLLDKPGIKIVDFLCSLLSEKKTSFLALQLFLRISKIVKLDQAIFERALDLMRKTPHLLHADLGMEAFLSESEENQALFRETMTSWLKENNASLNKVLESICRKSPLALSITRDCFISDFDTDDELFNYFLDDGSDSNAYFFKELIEKIKDESFFYKKLCHFSYEKKHIESLLRRIFEVDDDTFSLLRAFLKYPGVQSLFLNRDSDFCQDLLQLLNRNNSRNERQIKNVLKELLPFFIIEKPIFAASNDIFYSGKHPAILSDHPSRPHLNKPG